MGNAEVEGQQAIRHREKPIRETMNLAQGRACSLSSEGWAFAAKLVFRDLESSISKGQSGGSGLSWLLSPASQPRENTAL